MRFNPNSQIYWRRSS